MTTAEPQRQSIQQTAGDDAIQIGVVYGNVYGSPTPEAEVSLDLDVYREHQLSQLAIWERQYTRLDVDPAVALAGQDLRPVADSRLPLTEAFLRYKRLVVVGGAGAGKTTSMLYLVASVLPGGSLARNLTDFIPIYIELGRFRNDSSTTPLDSLLLLVADTLFRGKACQEPPSLRGVRQLLASHRFFFLLDGLNEAQAEFRTSCLRAIDDLAKRYSSHRIVLSSRPHGFSPPQGWEVVLLRELEESQISGFVERYAPDEASQPLLQTVLEAQNPLLRLPLFLSLVIRMSGSPLPDLQRRLRSRSGLVAQYVEFLLQRDLSTKNVSPAERLPSDRLREALGHLAQAFQLSGQILTLADARRAIEAGTSGHPEERRQILDDLCGRGLLATDGQNLRFWHQTIQEYFYAGSIVRRWRGSAKQIGRMPWWLRRLAAKPEEEEALSFMVAHLRDDEVEAALYRGLTVRPALAISWADDLSLEGRVVQATEGFPAKVRKFALAACAYTGFGPNRSAILLALAVQNLILAIPCSGVLRELFIWTGAERGFAGTLSLYCTFFLGCLQPLDALRRPSLDKLESALGAIPSIRNELLRRALGGALAQEINRPSLFRPSVRALAVLSGLDAARGKDLIKLLRTSEAPYAMTRSVGHLDAPFVVPILEEILKLNNSLSLAALSALATRAHRLRDERQKIIGILWKVWNDKGTDILIRRLARKLLLRSGENPKGQWLLLQYFILRILEATGIVTALYLGFILAIFLEPESGCTLAAISFAAQLGVPAFIWWDARKIGARGIQGYLRFENSTPRTWALGSLILPFLLIPWYFLNRQRIRRDAIPVDWDAILRTLQETEPKDDNLPMPPSALSPSR